MKLNVHELRQIAWGAVCVCEEDGGVCFHRFTQEQRDLYERSDADLFPKCKAPAGVRLVFRTDSRKLAMKATVSQATARRYFAFDVCRDGELIGSMDNFTGVRLPEDITTAELPWGTFSREFDLGEGEKTVTVHLPWSLRIVLEEFVLDDGAFVTPVRRKKKMLIFGDSITQGYDSLHPSTRYAGLLADSLNAEEFNKAIGGEVFFPELAAEKDDFETDYISVAYGTNDWGKVTAEHFERCCGEFYRTLSANYPNAKIFAITPIWRKDIPDWPERGAFERIAARIAEVVKELPNVTLIDGWKFVPADETYFADLRLHPNDKGFAEYHKNLWNAIQKSL